MTTLDSGRTVRVIGPERGYSSADLVAPTPHGYLLLAVETGRRPVWLPAAADKRRFLRSAVRAAAELRATPDVLDATVFDAILIPPGRGRFLRRRPGEFHPARYDVVVLVEVTTPDEAPKLRASRLWQALEQTARQNASHTLELLATNVRRMGDVDHSRDGVFLFNYFFADDTDQNIAVWEHTAGWWQQEAALDNSEVLLPDPGKTRYTIINHCRWDHLRDFLPSLLFKPTFRTYLQANFDANDVAPMPILYRRVAG